MQIGSYVRLRGTRVQGVIWKFTTWHTEGQEEVVACVDWDKTGNNTTCHPRNEEWSPVRLDALEELPYQRDY